MQSLVWLVALAGSPALAAPSDPAAVPAEAVWRYAGPGGEAELGLAAIVERVKAAPDATHYVWQPGWASWKSWKDVPEIADAVKAAQAPAAPPTAPATAAAVTLAYTDGGPTQTLTPEEIAKRVAANPDGRHLAWKPGMAEWADAKTVPEVQAAMAPKAAPAAPPVPPAPPAKAPPPAPEARDAGGASTNAALLRSWVQVHGEVRASGGVGGLGVPEGQPQPSFVVSRARPQLDGGVGAYAAGRVSVDVLPGADGGLDLVAQEAWAEARFGTDAVQNHLRGGMMESAFGLRDYLEGFDNYYVGGDGTDVDLAMRFGELPENDAGVAWRTTVKDDLFAFDVQAMNGEGNTSTGGPGMDLIVRAHSHPVEMVGVWASALIAGEGDEAQTRTTLFSGAVEARVKVFRVAGEVVYGSSRTPNANLPKFGYLATGAVDLPMKGEAVERAMIVARYVSYDPVFGNTIPDGSYAIDAGAHVFWKPAVEGVSASTGLVYQGAIPQNIEEPITHRVALAFSAGF